MVLRLKEAILHANRNNKRVTMKSLSLLLWENTNPHTLNNNIHNLATGKTDRVKVDWVKIICDETGVDANFLFGIKQMKTDED
jgi:hypothetical protein